MIIMMMIIMMMIIMMMMIMIMMIIMQRITAHLLSTTVQKQPVGLSLDWSSLGKQQLNWLVFIHYLFIYTTSKISTQYLHYIFTISAAAAAAPDEAAEPGGPGLHHDGVHPQHLQLSPAPGGLYHRNTIRRRDCDCWLTSLHHHPLSRS